MADGVKDKSCLPHAGDGAQTASFVEGADPRGPGQLEPCLRREAAGSRGDPGEPRPHVEWGEASHVQGCEVGAQLTHPCTWVRYEGTKNSVSDAQRQVSGHHGGMSLSPGKAGGAGLHLIHVVSEKPGAKGWAARLHRVCFSGHAHAHGASAPRDPQRPSTGQGLRGVTTVFWNWIEAMAAQPSNFKENKLQKH